MGATDWQIFRFTRCAVRDDHGVRCGKEAGHDGPHLAHVTPVNQGSGPDATMHAVTWR